MKYGQVFIAAISQECPGAQTADKGYQPKCLKQKLLMAGSVQILAKHKLSYSAEQFCKIQTNIYYRNFQNKLSLKKLLTT